MHLLIGLFLLAVLMRYTFFDFLKQRVFIALRVQTLKKRPIQAVLRLSG